MAKTERSQMVPVKMLASQEVVCAFANESVSLCVSVRSCLFVYRCEYVFPKCSCLSVNIFLWYLCVCACALPS